MEKLIEFSCVVYLTDSEEDEKLQEMGVQVNSARKEKIVRYSFNPTLITEVRETFVKYEGEWYDAVIVTFTENNYETPPLVITYDEFKQRINEHNKKNITVR